MTGVNQCLKAATLMESLIAMIIIVMCLATATMIYANVLASDKQCLQLNAMLILNHEAQKAKAENNFVDSENQVGEWKIIKTVEHYDQTENVYQLTLIMNDQDGKVIASRYELITTE